MSNKLTHGELHCDNNSASPYTFFERLSRICNLSASFTFIVLVMCNLQEMGMNLPRMTKLSSPLQFSLLGIL